MITGALIGRAETVAGFPAMASRIEAELRQEIEALTIKLLRKVKSEKLSGQVLKNRTGTLRASVNYRMELKPRNIYGRVGTNKEYAAAHEYGFTGVVNVQDHLRTITSAFGKALLAPKQVTVRAHSRNMALPERSFLRSSIREMAGEIRTRLRGALTRITDAR